MNFLSMQSKIFEMHNLMNHIQVENANNPNNSFKTPLPFLQDGHLVAMGYNPTN
jgi:hypothetical protein